MNKAHFFAHLRKVRTHRKWVRHYCSKVGLHWQGLVHDLSKYSPTEFWESVEYYQGNRSPIDACKEKNGYSLTWFHHRGRNKHHMEYWTDRYDTGTSCVPMPYKYATELICDWLGAGRAYMGSNFSYEKELEYIEKKFLNGIKLHPFTAQYILTTFEALTEYDDEKYVFNKLKFYYECAERWWHAHENEYPYVFFGSSIDYLSDL